MAKFGATTALAGESAKSWAAASSSASPRPVVPTTAWMPSRA